MRAALVGAAAAVVLLAVAAVPASHAYKLGGKKWPTRTITYHSAAPQFDEAIKQAVHAWNTSGVAIRFKPAPKRRAKLQIGYQDWDNGLDGHATIGWVPVRTYTLHLLGGTPVYGHVRCGMRMPLPSGRLARVRCVRVTDRPRMWLKKLDRESLSDPFSRNEMALTVAHELGHVLGLDHVRNRCAVMNAPFLASCPEPPHPWQLRCRLLEADDVRGAIRRYGGRMSPLPPEFCDSHPAPEAPLQLSARFAPESRAITATWRNPPAQGSRFVRLSVGLEACPPEPGPHSESVEPGATGTATTDVGDEGGRACVAVWTTDGFGRLSAPATTWVDVPPLEYPSSLPAAEQQSAP
jgi:hypothetical protein